MRLLVHASKHTPTRFIHCLHDVHWRWDTN